MLYYSILCEPWGPGSYLKLIGLSVMLVRASTLLYSTLLYSRCISTVSVLRISRSLP